MTIQIFFMSTSFGADIKLLDRYIIDSSLFYSSHIANVHDLQFAIILKKLLSRYKYIRFERIKTLNIKKCVLCI